MARSIFQKMRINGKSVTLGKIGEWFDQKKRVWVLAYRVFGGDGQHVLRTISSNGKLKNKVIPFTSTEAWFNFEKVAKALTKEERR